MSKVEEFVQFIERDEWFHATMAKRITNEESSDIVCRFGGSDTKRFSITKIANPERIAEVASDYGESGHPIKFINRINVCPCCGATEPMNPLTGNILTGEQMFENFEFEEIDERSPIYVWPHYKCITSNKYDKSSVKAYINDVFWDCSESITTKEVITRLGWDEIALGDVLANGLPHTNKNDGTTLINRFAFSSFVAEAWTRLITMDTFHWATKLEIKELKQDSPINGFNVVTFRSNESGVYLLLRGNEVVYVGQSKCVCQRVSAHVGEKEFDNAVYVKVVASRLLEIERQWINKFNPVYNKDMLTVKDRLLHLGRNGWKKYHEERLFRTKTQ